MVQPGWLVACLRVRTKVRSIRPTTFWQASVHPQASVHRHPYTCIRTHASVHRYPRTQVSRTQAHPPALHRVLLQIGDGLGRLRVQLVDGDYLSILSLHLDQGCTAAAGSEARWQIRATFCDSHPSVHPSPPLRSCKGTAARRLSCGTTCGA